MSGAALHPLKQSSISNQPQQSHLLQYCIGRYTCGVQRTAPRQGGVLAARWLPASFKEEYGPLRKKTKIFSFEAVASLVDRYSREVRDLQTFFRETKHLGGSATGAPAPQPSPAQLLGNPFLLYASPYPIYASARRPLCRARPPKSQACLP